ncbi:MAG TPA: hypothetical protein VNJ02_03775 [Vicinamibacterales bacterium]|nr:hypothetical protein [Vicinamibacterales bacterium]
MNDTVDAQIAWRLPLGVNAEELVAELLAWLTQHLGATSWPPDASQVLRGPPVTLRWTRTEMTLRFRGWVFAASPV